MVLNNRCTRCLYRGHQKNGRCKWVKANLEIFENLAKHGYVTGNRNRDWGARNGVYPLIRLLQLHHVAMKGGYARLLSLKEQEGRKLVDRRGSRQPALSLGRRGAAGDADNCGKCLHTSKSTHGPQRSAKTGLHHGDATPSSKNQDPAQKSHVGRDRETG
jgi:hypothetical protein